MRAWIIFLFLLVGCGERADGPNTTPPSAQNYLAWAIKSVDNGDLEEARRLLDVASTRAASDSSDLASEIGITEAEIALKRGQYNEAQSLLDALVDDYSAVAVHDSTHGRALVVRAVSNLRLGNYEQARDDADRALALIEPVFGFDHELVGRALHYRGLAFHEGGSLFEALRAYNLALDTKVRVHGRYSRTVAATYNNIGNVKWRLALYDEALANHLTALEIKSEVLDAGDQDLGISYANLANLHAIVQDSARAEYFYNKALRIYEESGANAIIVAQAQDNLGELLMNRGELDSAKRLLDEAASKFRSELPPRHGSIGVSDVHRGRLAILTGHVEAGLEQMTRGTMTMLEADRPDASFEVGSLARQLYDLGYEDEADDLINLAVDRVERDFGNDNPHIRRLVNIQVQHLVSNDRPEAALDLIRDYELVQTRRERLHPSTRGQRLSDPEHERSLLLWLQAMTASYPARALTQDQMRELMRTVVSLTGGIERELRFAGLLAESSSRQRFIEIVDAAIELCLKADSPPIGALFQLLEARQNVDSSVDYGREVAQSAGVPEVKLRHERRLLASLASLRIQRKAALQNGLQPGDIQHIQSDIVASEDSLDELVASFEMDYPRYHSLRFGQVRPSLTTVQSRLSPTSSLLNYFRSGEELFALAIDRDAFRLTSLGPADDVDYLADHFSTAVQFDAYGDIRTNGRILYERLVAPLLRLANREHWVIVPGPSLQRLPFEALVAATGSADGEKTTYLIEQKTVSYAYSSSHFAATSVATGTSTSRALFLAAPVFPGGITVPSAQLGIDSGDEMTTFSELRGTGVEAVAVDRLFEQLDRGKSGPTDILISKSATEDAIKQADLREYRYIHFATHGYTNPAKSHLAGLLLEPGSGEDGILSIGEVLALELQAEMVVLSACQTGLESDEASDGLFGLGRAFFSSGSQTVVASLWNSSDTYSAATMAEMYSELLEGGGKAAALRRAKLEIMRDPAVADRPSIWAPFILLGSA